MLLLYILIYCELKHRYRNINETYMYSLIDDYKMNTHAFITQVSQETYYQQGAPCEAPPQSQPHPCTATPTQVTTTFPVTALVGAPMVSLLD